MSQHLRMPVPGLGTAWLCNHGLAAPGHPAGFGSCDLACAGTASPHLLLQLISSCPRSNLLITYSARGFAFGRPATGTGEQGGLARRLRKESKHRPEPGSSCPWGGAAEATQDKKAPHSALEKPLPACVSKPASTMGKGRPNGEPCVTGGRRRGTVPWSGVRCGMQGAGVRSGHKDTVAPAGWLQCDDTCVCCVGRAG